MTASPQPNINGLSPEQILRALIDASGQKPEPHHDWTWLRDRVAGLRGHLSGTLRRASALAERVGQLEHQLTDPLCQTAEQHAAARRLYEQRMELLVQQLEDLKMERSRGTDRYKKNSPELYRWQGEINGLNMAIDTMRGLL